MNLFCLLALGIISIVCIKNADAYTCRDEIDQPIDWFIALKFHYINKYAYLSPVQHEWKMTNYGVNESRGFLYHTLRQVYDNLQDQQSMHVMYNDERGKDSVSYFLNERLNYVEYGHMKGVLSFQQNKTGFWLVHSAPKFPDTRSFSYPNTALRYGQSFFCATYNYRDLGVIARQVLIGRPDVYMHTLSDAVLRDFPVVQNFIKPPIVKIQSNILALVTTGGNRLVHFMKSAAFGDDLYNALVAPKLRQNIYVESWRHGKELLGSNCTLTYDTYNLELLIFKSLKRKIITTEDHSKWLVTQDNSTVCIGDINREETQFRRGGGTLCFSNSVIAQQFGRLIAEYSPCKRNK